MKKGRKSNNKYLEFFKYYKQYVEKCIEKSPLKPIDIYINEVYELEDKLTIEPILIHK